MPQNDDAYILQQKNDYVNAFIMFLQKAQACFISLIYQRL